MITKEEFERQWNQSPNEIREIYLGTMSGTIATSYEYKEFKELDNKPFMKLSLYGYRVAIIYLGDIIKVR